MKKIKSNESQIYLKNILQYSPGSIYWKDLNGVYLGCNQIQAEMAGFKSPEDMIGKTDFEMPWSDTADIIVATDKRIMISGTPEELIESVNLSNGTKLSMLTNKAPLCDDEGKIIGVIGTSLDVTARIKAEKKKESLSQAVKTYKIYLDNIIKNVPGAVYWKDLNGFYLGCTHFEAKITGLDLPEEIIGKTDYDLPWCDAADALRATDQKVMKTQTSEELTEVVTLADGKIVALLTNKAPLYDTQEKVIGIIGTSLDITAHVAAEDRERAALINAAEAEAQRKIEEEVKRAIMVLTGSMAHDLRTPLFSLNLINYQLKKDFSNLSQENQGEVLESIPGLIQKIDTTIKTMHQFIDQNLKALKYNTSDSLKKETLVECKSYKSINDALESYPFKDDEKALIKVDLSYYFTFLGNPIFFSRIMFNLLNNSLYQIHKNEKGKIFICSEEQEEFNIIRFKDTAGGAPPEVVDHIFNGYKTTKESGTGIGLAFCKITMESFGGNITCHSVEGDFIEFTLKFPKHVKIS